MEHYTKFELEVISGEKCETNYEKLITDRIRSNPFQGCTKWREFEKDMREISKEHQGVLLELSGEGDGELWKAYFRDGKMQMCRAKITFDSFNEDDLI